MSLFRRRPVKRPKKLVAIYCVVLVSALFFVFLEEHSDELENEDEVNPQKAHRSEMKNGDPCFCVTKNSSSVSNRPDNLIWYSVGILFVYFTTSIHLLYHVSSDLYLIHYLCFARFYIRVANKIRKLSHNYFTI